MSEVEAIKFCDFDVNKLQISENTNDYDNGKHFYMNYGEARRFGIQLPVLNCDEGGLVYSRNKDEYFNIFSAPLDRTQNEVMLFMKNQLVPLEELMQSNEWKEKFFGDEAMGWTMKRLIQTNKYMSLPFMELKLQSIKDNITTDVLKKTTEGYEKLEVESLKEYYELLKNKMLKLLISPSSIYCNKKTKVYSLNWKISKIAIMEDVEDTMTTIDYSRLSCDPFQKYRTAICSVLKWKSRTGNLFLKTDFTKFIIKSGFEYEADPKEESSMKFKIAFSEENRSSIQEILQPYDDFMSQSSTKEILFKDKKVCRDGEKYSYKPNLTEREIEIDGTVSKFYTMNLKFSFKRDDRDDDGNILLKTKLYELEGDDADPVLLETKTLEDFQKNVKLGCRIKAVISPSNIWAMAKDKNFGLKFKLIELYFIRNKNTGNNTKFGFTDDSDIKKEDIQNMNHISISDKKKEDDLNIDMKQLSISDKKKETEINNTDESENDNDSTSEILDSAELEVMSDIDSE